MDLSNICYTYVQLNVSMFFDENHVHSLRYWSRKHVSGGTVFDISGSCFCLEEASGIYRIYQAMEGARRAPADRRSLNVVRLRPAYVSFPMKSVGLRPDYVCFLIAAGWF